MSPAHQQLRDAWKASGLSLQSVAYLAQCSEETARRVLCLGCNAGFKTIAAIGRTVGLTSLDL